MRILVATLILTGLLPTRVFADGLEYVQQTIYGMDCAPCAYGVEQGLKKLDAVEQVTVSLNDGFAKVHFGKDSAATLADIRRIIRENGFTPKDAEVNLTGRIIASKNDATFSFTTGHETFTATFSTPSLREKLSATTKEPVTVTGTVDADRDDEISIHEIR